MGTFSGQRRRPSSASGWKIKFAFLGVLFSIFIQGVLCEGEPTESECRPYIEKALKEQHLDVEGKHVEEALNEQEGNPPTDELTDSTEDTVPNDILSADGKDDDDDSGEVQKEDEDDDNNTEEHKENDDNDEDVNTEEEDRKTEEQFSDVADDDKNDDESMEKDGLEVESAEENDNNDEDDEKLEEATEEQKADDEKSDETEIESEAKDEKSLEKEGDDDVDDDDDRESILERPIEVEVQEVEMDDDDDNNDEDTKEAKDDVEGVQEEDEEEEEKEEKEKEEEGEGEKEEVEEGGEKEEVEEGGEKEEVEEEREKEEEAEDEIEDDKTSEKDDGPDEDEDKTTEKVDVDDEKTEEREDENDEEDNKTDEKDEEDTEEKESEVDNEEEKKEQKDDDDDEKTESADKKYDNEDDVEVRLEKREVKESEKQKAAESEDAEDSKEDGDQESTPEEEELIKEVVIPDNLRPRDHINKILKLDEVEMETILEKTIDATLKSLKGLYDNAIKPLEMLYKYRDLSNRHFGDPEIFSKPLILFMGPWSGGKSSTINYLLNNEFSHTSLRTGAEPSPAYFNILMHGEREEILDGTQLAADWTFSGLQKFGQSLLDRLKGIKLPNKLLEKVNIVEIPGILEIRKQVQRLFPFNDACQWFIDRADIIFLVYDPSKLDVGPETEAILDQLKGREYQTRIILNKADQVKPEELMRVQGTLIWNISPLMSSSEPPIMYSTSLWSLPYEAGAPTRLLLAQERAFLRDLREAIDKRVENKIASARRFAVRVRNHAKMVDCYLTTYYNHKTFFGNRKKISDDIIEYPQKYHIYEGLSTLTNISRYDLPDPDVYRDFFKINPLYEFKKLSETCTYFRGCPINQLDVAIAYDLPEMVGKYKKAVESAKEQQQKENS